MLYDLFVRRVCQSSFMPVRIYATLREAMSFLNLKGSVWNKQMYNDGKILTNQLTPENMMKIHGKIMYTVTRDLLKETHPQPACACAPKAFICHVPRGNLSIVMEDMKNY